MSQVSSAPTFLYRNHCGTYCFQRRIPQAIRSRDFSRPLFFRTSLRTKNRKDALRLARKIVVIFDELAQIYFSDEQEFIKAMELNVRSIQAESQWPDFDEYQENFLDHLDDDLADYQLLFSKIARYNKARRFEAKFAHHPDVTNSSQPSIEEVVKAAAKEAIKEIHQTDVNDYRSVPLSEAYDVFLKEKSQNWKANGKLLTAFPDEVFPIFTFATENCKTSEISVNHVAKYKEFILKLPANKNKKLKYRNLSLEQIYKIEVPQSDQIKGPTKKNYLDRLGIFLDWLSNNNYSKPNLSAPLQKVIKTNSVAHKDRNKYSEEDLKRLFNSKQYINGTHDRPFKFWIPLIGILTGARINEIAQLNVEDIYENKDAECWILDINTDDDDDSKKSLKRDSHKRQTPIHPALIELGLHEYAEKLKEYGFTRLFPELPFNELGNYGVTASKWFNNTYTNSRNCSTVTPNTSFHSLRHNFIDYVYSTLNIPESAFAHYVGQAAQGGVGITRYAKPTELQNALKIIEKINYNNSIDFKKIKHWKNQRFGIQLQNRGAFIEAWIKE